MVTLSERKLRNALKFGTTREVNSKEGLAPAEGGVTLPIIQFEGGSPQVELDGAVGEIFIP